MLRIGLIASLFVLFGQGQASILKAWEINAVMKRKDSNCVSILSDQGEAATASNLNEFLKFEAVRGDLTDRMNSV